MIYSVYANRELKFETKLKTFAINQYKIYSKKARIGLGKKRYEVRLESSSQNQEKLKIKTLAHNNYN